LEAYTWKPLIKYEDSLQDRVDALKVSILSAVGVTIPDGSWMSGLEHAVALACSLNCVA